MYLATPILKPILLLMHMSIWVCIYFTLISVWSHAWFHNPTIQLWLFYLLVEVGWGSNGSTTPLTSVSSDWCAAIRIQRPGKEVTGYLILWSDNLADETNLYNDDIKLNMSTPTHEESNTMMCASPEQTQVPRHHYLRAQKIHTHTHTRSVHTRAHN